MKIQNFCLTMSVTDLDRAFLKGKVLALLSEGLSVRQIGCKAGVPERIIRHWRSENFRLERRKATGRPRMTSIRTDRSLIRTVLHDPTVSRSQTAADTCGSISRKSIHRRLQKAALVSRKRPSRLELTTRHKEVRMTWAMSHCH